MISIIESDVLIIGSGIAGACCALELANKNIKVSLINKMPSIEESNTKYAQGGIVGEGIDDNPELLIQDILAAGDGLGYHKAVKMLATQGPKLVNDFLISQIGVDFNKDQNGNLLRTYEAAHSTRRVLFVKDHTGSEIIHKLFSKIENNPLINVYTNHVAIDIITTNHHSNDPLDIYEDNKCLGAYVYDSKEEKVKIFFAKKTVLATGGVGNIFLYTSNPGCATGDGLAMAYRAGAKIINAEYVQFHPTTLFHRDANRFLISESLRGEGARLKDHTGKYFMESYEPSMRDLAPRDVISRAIYEELHKTDKGYVLLDTSPISEKGIDLSKRYPTIYNHCLSLGIDIIKSPIPVVPAAHYFCGGIKVDLDGNTDINNLYAIGEVSCTGVHGANRLASISLLEGLVWGIRSGKDIINTITNIDTSLFNKISPWKDVKTTRKMDPILLFQDWLTIRTTMWNYAGIIRTKRRLTRALADLGYLSHRIEQFYKESLLTKDLIELRNGMITSFVVVRSALSNKNSMGCHYRID